MLHLKFKFIAVSFLMTAIIGACQFFPGQSIFDAKCKEDGGARIPQTLKADGYFDQRFYKYRELFGHPEMYFMHAVKDLGDGRISFFEIHKSDDPRPKGSHVIIKDPTKYERFFVDVSGSPLCKWSESRSFWGYNISLLGYGKCLAREAVDQLKSQYKVKYEKSDNEPGSFSDIGWERTTVVDRLTGETVAAYTDYVHFNIQKFETTGVDARCPDNVWEYPHPRMTEAVFQDRDGKVVDLYSRREYVDPRKLIVPENIEVHKIRVGRGKPFLRQHLSSVNLIVTVAERPVFLVLEADTEVMWSVVAARGASVLFIVVNGSTPQTVGGWYGNAKVFSGPNATKDTRYPPLLLPSKLGDIFNAPPRSIQEYSEAPEIIVDGVTRVKPQ